MNSRHAAATAPLWAGLKIGMVDRGINDPRDRGSDGIRNNFAGSARLLLSDPHPSELGIEGT